MSCIYLSGLQRGVGDLQYEPGPHNVQHQQQAQQRVEDVVRREHRLEHRSTDRSATNIKKNKTNVNCIRFIIACLVRTAPQSQVGIDWRHQLTIEYTLLQ